MRVTAPARRRRWRASTYLKELSRLVVDETGAVDPSPRQQESRTLVRFSTALRAERTRSLRVVYHGDLLTSARLGGQPFSGVSSRLVARRAARRSSETRSRPANGTS